MHYYTEALEKVIEGFSRFPGIGFKTAEKLAFYLLKVSEEEVFLLSRSIEELKEKTKFCRVCYNLTEGEVCKICEDEGRDRSIICVVEGFKDLVIIEKTGDYQGLYHVLMGHLSPIDGVGVGDLKIKELISRIGEGTKEVILACNPNLEGDATSQYIAGLLGEKGIKMSRIACGVPLGGNLEYTDAMTLSRAILKREEMGGF